LVDQTIPVIPFQDKTDVINTELVVAIEGQRSTGVFVCNIGRGHVELYNPNADATDCREGN
jgi:hypothetical protein